jgi:hypothetical protein
MLILLAVLLAVTDGLFGDARTGIATSTALFASAAFVAGGRSLVASAFAIATAPEIRPAVTGLRARRCSSATSAGSIAGGAALSVGGYGALASPCARALFLGALRRSPAVRLRQARPPARLRACPPACAATGSLPNARVTSNRHAVHSG